MAGRILWTGFAVGFAAAVALSVYVIASRVAAAISGVELP